MKIAIIYNKFEREYASVTYLAQQIKKAVPEAEIFTAIFHDENLLEKIIEFQPEVLFTFPLTAKSLAWYPYLAKVLFKCKILSYRVEGIIGETAADIYFHAGQENYGPHLIDCEIFWGTKQYAVISEELCRQKKLSSKKRTAVTGSLSYDLLINSHSILPEKIKKRIDSYKKENIFIFITGFHFSDYTDEDIFKAGDLINLSDPHIDEAYETLKKCRDRSIIYRQRWIDGIIDVASSNPDCLIIVKPHPVEIEQHKDGIPDKYLDSFKQYTNILYIKESCSTEELIARSALIVHYGSTCLAAAYIYGTYSILSTADDLFETIKNIPYAVIYCNIGWPSHATTPITNISNFISINKHKFSSPSRLANIDKILLDNFNFMQNELYRPSKAIIEIITDKNKMQTQDIMDSPLDMYWAYHRLHYHRYEIIINLFKNFLWAAAKIDIKGVKKIFSGLFRLKNVLWKGNMLPPTTQ